MQTPHRNAPTGLALALIAGLCAAGCPGPAPSAPPPAPPGQAGAPTLPEMPPDPRALKKPDSGEAAPIAVGTRALPSTPVDGSALNRFFPKDGGGDDVTYTQEKRGTSIAQVSRGGKVVAQISITDAAENPALRDKFKKATGRISGYPSAGASSAETAVLVADRFQVKVRSQGSALGPAQREAILMRFDLTGLAALE